MVKRKKMIGGADVPVLTKQEVLADPKIKEALKVWAVQQGGAKKQLGKGSWWSDFVSWLKDNKVISIASKIGSAISGAIGFVPLSTALAGISATAGSLGYGKKMRGGMYSYDDAQRVALAIAGRRPAVRIKGKGATSIAYNTPSSDTPTLKW